MVRLTGERQPHEAYIAVLLAAMSARHIEHSRLFRQTAEKKDRPLQRLSFSGATVNLASPALLSPLGSPSYTPGFCECAARW